MESTPDAGLRQRYPPTSVPSEQTQQNGRPKLHTRKSSNHPGGKVKHGALMQFLRMCAFAAYFNGSIVGCGHFSYRKLEKLTDTYTASS